MSGTPSDAAGSGTPGATAIGSVPGYPISELFMSLQGEGPSAGRPAHFLRLQGCDVGCHWCDTKYSWSPEAGREMTVRQIMAELKALGEAPLLVVTGGEPLRQPGLRELLAAMMPAWTRVEVETSGVAPPPFTHERLHYNVSPKLPSATPRWEETWRHVRDYSALPSATFKIVVGDPPDDADALRLIRQHELEPDRVMLMPEGMTDDAVRRHAATLVELCKRNGFTLSPRLHIWIWGAKRGV